MFTIIHNNLEAALKSIEEEFKSGHYNRAILEETSQGHMWKLKLEENKEQRKVYKRMVAERDAEIYHLKDRITTLEKNIKNT